MVYCYCSPLLSLLVASLLDFFLNTINVSHQSNDKNKNKMEMVGTLELEIGHWALGMGSTRNVLFGRNVE